MSLRWVPKWIVKILGDDRNLLHPAPAPTLKCEQCRRFVMFAEKSLDLNEWIHADDASPICKPIGLYRDHRRTSETA